MTQPSILDAAKQGNPQAIAALMNRSLNPKGIRVKTKVTAKTLHVALEAEHVPNQGALVAYVSKSIANLKIETVENLIVYGQSSGGKGPQWTEQVDLSKPEVEPSVELPPSTPESAATNTIQGGSPAKPTAAGCIGMTAFGLIVCGIVALCLGVFSPPKPKIAAAPTEPTEAPSSQAIAQPSSPESNPAVVNGRLPEQDLAIIDQAPSLTNRYAALLDEVETKCNEPRRSIADMTVKTVEMTASKGGRTNNLDMLTGLRNALEPYQAGNKQDCAPVYAVLYTIVTEGK